MGEQNDLTKEQKTWRRICLEQGLPDPYQEQPLALVSIEKNIVRDFHLLSDPRINLWRREQIRLGRNISSAFLEQARVMVGKRFQETNYGADHLAEQHGPQPTSS